MNKIFTVSIAHGPANEQCLVSFWRKQCYIDHVILSVLEGVLNYIVGSGLVTFQNKVHCR